jgi:hypothetical protein
MNLLESQKTLLVAESELNRANLAGDVAEMRTCVHSLAVRAKSFGLFASSSAVVLASLAAFHRGKPVDASPKPSWLQTIRKGAGLFTHLWVALRSQKSP